MGDLYFKSGESIIAVPCSLMCMSLTRVVDVDWREIMERSTPTDDSKKTK